MKTRINLKLIGLIFLLSTGFSMAQVTEFDLRGNGLMYNDTTMSQLKHIVDSLNLKYKRCDLNKTYYTKYQVKGHYFKLNKGNIKRAKKDVESKMSFEQFVKKYPAVKVTRDLLVIKYNYLNYQGKDEVMFRGYLNEISVRIQDSLGQFDNPGKNTWVFRHWKGGEYTEESIYGFYITSDYKADTIPETYAKMILYSDCLIDTTSRIFTEKATKSGIRWRGENSTKVDQFIKYVHRKTNKPKYDKLNTDRYYKRYDKWTSGRYKTLDKLKDSDTFKKKIEEAVEEALDGGIYTAEFEGYVARYYSSKTALILMRNRKVIGSCSMDNSPRIHALNIALLSAETVNWEIFLRAHLDIMNDNFSRVSDGSWAQAGRKTYIKELEELDIDVKDLIMGITFRMENPSQNHYYGSIYRLGRALSESKDSVELESRMLEIIRDEALDDYNRLLVYYLFSNYNHYSKDKVKKERNWKRLKEAVKTMPAYLAKPMDKEVERLLKK